MCDIFEAILEPDALPALVHCAAGKDRTGLTIALLLELVGVPREIISADYALSAECLGPEYIAESQIWVTKQGRDWTLWAHLFESPPERMLKTLDYVDQQFGGLEAYLTTHGLDRAKLTRLRDLLVEDA